MRDRHLIRSSEAYSFDSVAVRFVQAHVRKDSPLRRLVRRGCRLGLRLIVNITFTRFDLACFLWMSAARSLAYAQLLMNQE